VVIASFSFFLAIFVSKISFILDVVFALSILVALSGFVATLVGAIGWAFQSSILMLGWIGFALAGVGIVCVFGISQIQFDFDDPRILLFPVACMPLLVGALFLVFAAIRRARAGFARASK